MGGGVGIGDFNNDGLKDIFFTGNQVSCKLYINKGNNQFEDITKQAGLSTDVWATGVSVVDINNDGYDDLYICVFGKNLSKRSNNLLFINQKNLTFKEQSKEYGLSDTGYSTQAVFLDYDRDGDLDMYLANYLLGGPNPNSIFPKDLSGHSPANDKLFRNDGVTNGSGHPCFTDVSLEAGIKEDGYGLGVVSGDFNNDGWQDIYVANDFLSNDELWLNNGNGGFTNSIARSMKHQSYSSMGVDNADINNDGLADITTLDMLPEYNERKKLSFSFMNYERYQSERSMGYQPEFTRNMLQLNNGAYHKGDTSVPFYSEIGQLSGISATDWSWSVLMADYDLDGWKDIHITNGIGRDFINSDFLEFSNSVFESGKTKEEQQRSIRQKLASLNHIKLGNYLYLNNHDLTFTDASEEAGINEASMSNGAAYADLDNDGDLDMIVNNINKEAFLFINNSIQKGKPVTNHFLSLDLKGNAGNEHGFGCKVTVYTGGHQQMQEQNPVRGYFSSVDQRLNFGLGKYDHADSIVITWPGNKRQVIKNQAADTLLLVSQQGAGTAATATYNAPFIFTDAATMSGILYKHTDHNFNDFGIQRLLPQKFSQLGPFITTGDMNNDGLTDFFVGGAVNFSGKIFLQQPGGTFLSHDLTDSTKMEEDMSSLLFDADGDGDADLLVTSGDVRFEERSLYNRPRLYLNDGKGNFKLNKNAFPVSITTVAGTVSAADYDGDGDLDLFTGGRVSGRYPLPPQSFLLQNNHGKFTDVTATVCPALERAGMITSSAWMDFNGDHQQDLVIAGEWMAIRFFKNDHGILKEVTEATGLTQMDGLWRSLVVADIDNDGDDDLVAGNLGLNCIYHADINEPMKLFAKDIDGNGIIDPVMFYYIRDKDGKRRLYPGISRAQFADQVPVIKKQFLLNKDYAHASFEQIYRGKLKDSLINLTCNETRSCYFENKGGGKFLKHPLPVEAQFAPVNTIVCEDLDHDGYKDLLLAGNEYQADVLTGRYDASYGCFLKGNGTSSFKVVPPAESGLIFNGDVKDMKIIQLADKSKLVLAAINNDSLRVFKVK